METEKQYLACEKRWVFALLIFVAGLYAGYTLLVRGGVFCNGQTGNLALLAVALGNGNWNRAAYYLIPFSAYLLGMVVSEWIPRSVRHFGLRWDTLLLLIEIGAVTVMGFIPASAPHQICQVIINFLCAMQYATFRQAEGMNMASTICVSHIRTFGTALSRILRGRKDKYPKAVEQAKVHGGMILCFFLGAVTAALAARLIHVHTIWLALPPLAVVTIWLLRADLVTEKSLLEVVPGGH